MCVIRQIELTILKCNTSLKNKAQVQKTMTVNFFTKIKEEKGGGKCALKTVSHTLKVKKEEISWGNNIFIVSAFSRFFFYFLFLFLPSFDF
jgi:hypothetical protein